MASRNSSSEKISQSFVFQLIFFTVISFFFLGILLLIRPLVQPSIWFIFFPAAFMGIIFSLFNGHLRNIMKLKQQVENSFVESEKKFRGLLESACDPILIVNGKGIIEFANRQTQESFGYESRELLGQFVEVIIPERFRLSHVEKRNQYFKHPTSRPMSRSLQLSARRKDGSEFPVDISLSP